MARFSRGLKNVTLTLRCQQIHQNNRDAVMAKKSLHSTRRWQSDSVSSTSLSPHPQKAFVSLFAERFSSLCARLSPHKDGVMQNKSTFIHSYWPSSDAFVSSRDRKCSFIKCWLQSTQSTAAVPLQRKQSSLILSFCIDRRKKHARISTMMSTFAYKRSSNAARCLFIFIYLHSNSYTSA
jgi:hypothetical protein